MRNEAEVDQRASTHRVGASDEKWETSGGHLMRMGLRDTIEGPPLPPSAVHHCWPALWECQSQTLPQEQVAIDSDTASPPTRGSGSVSCCAMGKCSSEAATICSAACSSSRFHRLAQTQRGTTQSWTGASLLTRGAHGMDLSRMIVHHIHRAPWLSRAYEVTPDQPLEWCLQKYEQ